MPVKKCLLAIGLVLGLGLFGANVNAAVQNTGVLYGDTGFRKSCDLVNISGTSLKVTLIELIAEDGTVLTTNGPATLAPHTMIRAYVDDNGTFARCKFRTPDTVPASRFRASMSIFRDNGVYWETLAHEIAR